MFTFTFIWPTTIDVTKCTTFVVLAQRNVKVGHTKPTQIDEIYFIRIVDGTMNKL